MSNSLVLNGNISQCRAFPTRREADPSFRGRSDPGPSTAERRSPSPSPAETAGSCGLGSGLPRHAKQAADLAVVVAVHWPRQSKPPCLVDVHVRSVLARLEIARHGLAVRPVRHDGDQVPADPPSPGLGKDDDDVEEIVTSCVRPVRRMRPFLRLLEDVIPLSGSADVSMPSRQRAGSAPRSASHQGQGPRIGYAASATARREKGLSGGKGNTASTGWVARDVYPQPAPSLEVRGCVGRDMRLSKHPKLTLTFRPPRPYQRLTRTWLAQNLHSSHSSVHVRCCPTGLGGNHMATPRTLSLPSSLAT